MAGVSSFAHAARRRTLGIGFLVLLMAGVWLTYAVFTKKFTDYDEVTLLSSKTGLQLPERADVKIRGVLVGEVLEADASAQGARLTLGLYPDERTIIPADVTAKIVPKTLFGEKYVLLEPHGGTGGPSIQAGDVIRQTHVSIEVEKLLDDFYPFLRTVQPGELNYTLTAISNALEGRGEQIGRNLETFDSYLKRTNPLLPEMIEDLRLLGGAADLYDSVLGDVATTLRNSVRTGRTFVTKDEKVRALFADVAAFSDTARGFLQANGDNLVRLGEVSAAQLRVFAKYSPEYPCLTQGMVNWVPHMNSGWRGHELHIVLEVLPNSPTGYTPADSPEYGAENGPHCGALPNPPYDQENLAPQPSMHAIDDGAEDPHGKFRPRSAPTLAGGTDLPLTTGLAGSPEENRVLTQITSSVMGVPSDDVPDVAALLLGPIARGTEVNVR